MTFKKFDLCVGSLCQNDIETGRTFECASLDINRILIAYDIHYYQVNSGYMYHKIYYRKLLLEGNITVYIKSTKREDLEL